MQRKTWLFMLAISVFVLLGISGGLLNIAWIYMQHTFRVDVSAIGILLLFATTGGLIAAFSSGSLIKKYGIGNLTLAGAVVMCLGLFAIALSPTWIMLILIVLITYMGKGTLDAGMNNFVSENYNSTAMNWLHASWGVGLTLSPPLMTFIIITLGWSWRIGYVLVAMVMLLLVLVIFASRKQWDSSDDTTGSEHTITAIPSASMLEAIQQPVVLWSILLFFVYGGVEIGTGQLANTLLVEGRHLSQEIASFWLSLYWGSFTVGRLLIGIVALRIADKVILHGCVLLVLLGAMLLAISDFTIVSNTGLIFIGFGLSAIFPILIAQTPERVGRAFTAHAIGFQVGFAGLGAAVLPGIFGFVAAQVGFEAIAYGILINAVLLMILSQWVILRYRVIEVKTNG